MKLILIIYDYFSKTCYKKSDPRSKARRVSEAEAVVYT